MGYSYEEQLIRHIENSIRAIHLGKSPDDTQAGYALGRLRTCNDGQYDVYMLKYSKAVKDYNKKNEAKQTKVHKNGTGNV